MNTEYTINRLGHQGDGIADGPVYAPRTLPGEVVSGVLDGTQLNDIRIVTPSSDRVQPPCRHYKACGGCQLQHASDSFVEGFKLDVVRTALAAKQIETDLRPIVTSPAQSRRRATLAVRRTKKGAMAGFHGRASDVIVEIPDCRLLDPVLIAGIPVAEALATQVGSRKGVLTMAITVSDIGLDISVTGGKMLDGPLQLMLAQLTEQHGLARLAWDGDVIAMKAPATQTFGAAKVVPPPGSFLQPTKEGEAALLAGIFEITAGAKRIADLFAGCGTFSLPLAKDAEIYAVEGNADMTEALDHGWRMAQGLKQVTTEARDLYRRPMMPDELAKMDAVLIDPPRAGAEAQVAEIVQAQVPVVAYVSCNPVSFARDASLLVSGGYKLNWVQVVDQFRWSAHTELVASFTI